MRSFSDGKQNKAMYGIHRVHNKLVLSTQLKSNFKGKRRLIALQHTKQSPHLSFIVEVLLQREDVGPDTLARGLLHRGRQHLGRVLHEELHVLQQVHVRVDAVQQCRHFGALDAVEVHASQLQKHNLGK